MAKPQDLTEMTRGIKIDLGWMENEEGRWTPSAWDRRRLGVTTATMIAEANGLPFVPPELLLAGMVKQSTGKTDTKVLVENYNAWVSRNS